LHQNLLASRNWSTTRKREKSTYKRGRSRACLQCNKFELCGGNRACALPAGPNRERVGCAKWIRLALMCPHRRGGSQKRTSCLRSARRAGVREMWRSRGRGSCACEGHQCTRARIYLGCVAYVCPAGSIDPEAPSRPPVPTMAISCPQSAQASKKLVGPANQGRTDFARQFTICPRTRKKRFEVLPQPWKPPLWEHAQSQLPQQNLATEARSP